MSDAPERIWLQWEEDFGESTWCQDPINDEDVEYVRADLIAAQLQEARATIRNLSDTLELRLEEAVTYDECLADINSARAFLAKSR
jgi:hypothetical protein